jgi:hypothetical protein
MARSSDENAREDSFADDGDDDSPSQSARD